MTLERKILIVDDEPNILSSLERLFQKEGYQTGTAERGKDALELLRHEDFQVVLTDLKMPGEVNGMDILKTVRNLSLNCQVVLMTAFGTVDTAVEAMKLGAFHFVTKPFKKVQVLETVERAMEKTMLMEENRRLREKLSEMDTIGAIIGSSPAMRKPLAILKQAAPSNATMLIQGDSGTGKEVFAKAIYKLSSRAEKEFVAINCAALPSDILEAELFGYEPGAFTGAVKRRIGKIEASHSGTLFLDEVGDMSLPLQAKLLRVLQEGEFERLGSNKSIKVDFRLLAATNKNLTEEVRHQRFREDLYHRLNVIPLNLPPLRERTEDIPLLATHFIKRFCKENEKPLKTISTEAMQALMNHHWSGNVRELENRIERAVVLSEEETLLPEDFFEELPVEGATPEGITIPFGITLDEAQKLIIEETLKFMAGDKKQTANILGIALRTIYRKLG